MRQPDGTAQPESAVVPSAAEPSEETRRIRRIGTQIAVTGLLVAVIASVISYLALKQDKEGANRSTTDLVEFVSVQPNIKESIPVKKPDPQDPQEGVLVDGGTLAGGAGAIDVILFNRNEQTGLAKQIDVTIRDFAAISSCRGAGEFPASVGYDFLVPTEDLNRGHVISKKEFFTVEGKNPDRMRVAVGPESTAQGIWGWIYVVSVTLHLTPAHNGEPDRKLTSQDVIIVDGGVADIVSNQSNIDGNPEWGRCVQEHRQTISEMVNRPEPHSVALDDLKRAIDSLEI